MIGFQTSWEAARSYKRVKLTLKVSTETSSFQQMNVFSLCRCLSAQISSKVTITQTYFWVEAKLIISKSCNYCRALRIWASAITIVTCSLHAKSLLILLWKERWGIKTIHQPKLPLLHTIILSLFKMTPLKVHTVTSQQNGSGQNEVPE